MQGRRRLVLRTDEVRAARAWRFASELAETLRELKVTHKALAQELGVTLHTVDSWTRGADPSIPGQANLDKLCEFLEKQKPGAGTQIAHAAGHKWEPPSQGPKEPVRLHALGEPVPTNLPLALSSFIGREKELANAAEVLKARTTRLLTFTGPGGVGKTRLSQEVAGQVAEDFPDGVWLVEFASLADPQLVPQVVLAALGLREGGNRPITDVLIDYLRPKKVLLLLDNCEHLIDACAVLAATLLQACGLLTILATSREPLRVPGEIVRQVPSLSLPGKDDVETFQRTNVSTFHDEATRLFIERASAVQDQFELTAQNARAVAEVCVRLDGVPLAIELAAAQVYYTRVEQIAEKLNERFLLLTKGSRVALPRHQTLLAAIDWSYELLPGPEQLLFSRLSVFAGGWDQEAVETVCGSDALPRSFVQGTMGQLLHKSLLSRDFHEDRSAAGARYRMLETIREHAAQKLAAHGETDLIQEQHATYFLQLVEGAARELKGPQQAAWFERLEREQDNLRTALRWSLDHGRTEMALRLSGKLLAFWNRLGFISEGRQWIEAALGSDGEQSVEARARALNSAGVLAYIQGDHEHARARLEEGLALLRTLEDDELMPSALTNLGMVAGRLGNYAEARIYYEEALAKRKKSGNKRGIAVALINLAYVPLAQRDYGEAEALTEESLGLFREIGDNFGVANALDTLGIIVFMKGDYRRALEIFEQCLSLYREHNAKRAVAYVMKNLGIAAERCEETERASALLMEALPMAQALDDRLVASECLVALADVAWTRGQIEKAACLLGATELLYSEDSRDWTELGRFTYEHLKAEMRGTLDDTRIAAARKQGRAMSLQQAVAYALRRETWD